VTTPLEPPDAPAALIPEVVFPVQLTQRGTYFGGAALSFTASRVALGAATRVARADAVMAACERIDFGEPIGELVEASATGRP
jgi:acyl-CoA hydrolase